MWPYTVEEAEAWPAPEAHGEPAPRGELASRVLAMPADTNPAGDIFGGWIMSLMDSAGAMAAAAYAHGRVATVAVTDMSFHQPVKVGDTVCCYAALVRRRADLAHLPHRSLGASLRPRHADEGHRGGIHLRLR